jgi:hypothetical protein
MPATSLVEPEDGRAGMTNGWSGPGATAARSFGVRQIVLAMRIFLHPSFDPFSLAHSRLRGNEGEGMERR